MRLRLALLCLGLAALLAAAGEARAAGVTGAPFDTCQGENLWAEQVLFAEAALPSGAAADADDARCTADSPAAEDCIAPAGLSAPRPRSIGRCDVRFAGAPRLHLRAHGRSPLERAFGSAAPCRLQAGAAPPTVKDGAQAPSALLCATVRPPLPPPPALGRPGEPLLSLASGHRGRIERPPR